MGWDKGRYYTQSRKVNGRVVREYVGKGRVAELAAELDAIKRERRHLERLALQHKKNELAAIEADVKTLTETTDLVARAARCLLPVSIGTSGASGGNDVDKTTPRNEAAKKATDLQALADRAQEGDKSTLPALRELLKDPAMVNLLGGDLAHYSQQALISKFSGKNLLYKESLSRKLEVMRGELAGPNPTPLERLLVERVVTCWLHLHHLEANYAGKDSMSLQLGTYFQRSLSAAQKRYLSAIKTLALVRKLAVPVLQVNIARKQVNVAGPCEAVST